ncbi:MAG: hypothetical protein AOA65_2345 [Candidatus Bathyarchaeota archaeon BA1]|nr:MAG: hypothetical protein AOA65_2345 [Candidatus Bathyarchaeota archaeon BA1]
MGPNKFYVENGFSENLVVLKERMAKIIKLTTKV